ncbi:MAG: hypothetical protein HQK96_09740 [Nitrospirae bacterium]|nr:hypothetical protein [Nitrospirota bacterium]MBF0554818.1 hypothetical protein [Nitrospirota bacterium]
MMKRKNEKDADNRRTDFLAYIRKLDKLRWEWLMESDKYRSDYNLFKETYEGSIKGQSDASGDMPIHFINANIANIYHDREQSEISDLSIISLCIWRKYGLSIICSPDMSYDDVIRHLVLQQYQIGLSDDRKLSYEIFTLIESLRCFDITGELKPEQDKLYRKFEKIIDNFKKELAMTETTIDESKIK